MSPFGTMLLLVSTMEAVMHGAAVRHAILILLFAFRIRILGRTAAGMVLVMHPTTALPIHARLGCAAWDMANGVLLLGKREDVRVAARLGCRAALGVVLVFVLFFVGVMSSSAHG